jgi:flagella basal body P-ring formation protein FlgA
MSGKALADGAKGDLIKVRNDSSHRIVEGIVTQTGIVVVKM